MGEKKLDRVKIGIILGLSVILVLIIAQNTAPVPGRFLWFSGEVSAVVLLILSATVGFILGLLVALFTRREQQRKPSAESADDTRTNDR
jgi:uncharacterized integral membrane protein